MAAKATRRKLSTRLFAALFFVSFLVLLASAAALVAASWMVYEGDAEDRLAAQLEVSAQKLAGLDEQEMCVQAEQLSLADVRVTLVAPDGSVWFDSYVDAATLENHGNREEIAAAREGKANAVFRRSVTTGTDALYVATQIDGTGAVLRLSETRTSLSYYLGSLLVPLFMIVLFATALSLVLARFITKKVTAPLLSVSLEDPLASEAYAEVEPLLDRIDVQRRELLEQNSELEQAVNVRREFTGNVSHEMKSPLQVIGGYAELIESGITSPEDTKRFAGLIRTEAQSMRTLIDDVLLLSKLDEGAGGGALLEIDLASACERAIDRLEPAAAARKVHVRLKLQEDVVVLGSLTLVEQIVYNLVDNAIRYGKEHGEVIVETYVAGELVKLVVSDDGAGIPPEARERVFERFYRVDTSRSRDMGGTGLGLAIVKHAAESMNGVVSVGKSVLGGARFEVSLPVCNSNETSV